MGKIKDFVTGIFSKKDKEEVVEVMQLEPAAEPNRDFAEQESRYDTPDYQAFLHDMGYVDGDTDQRSASVPDNESSACEPEEVECCGIPAEECDKEESCDAPAEECDKEESCDAPAEETFIDDDEIAADTDMSEEDDLEEVEEPEDDFDQDFIEEGIAELGVNDVWPEEEN